MAALAGPNQHGFHTAEQQLQQEHATAQQPVNAAGSDAVWSNPNPPQPRGRAPRDPAAVVTKLDCQNLQDLEVKLRAYLDDRPAAPEHCTAELTLWMGASFIVKLDYVPPNLRGSQQQQQPDDHPLRAVADYNLQRLGQQQNTDGREVTISVLEALQQLNDPKETMKRQRAISKVCVAAVQRTDGFRYSFHNSWKSGEDNAYRFSYYCNDSLLNKDRVANGKSGSQGKRATKPVYDCKGVLSIKFSATRQCIDVVYKHVPCHQTYEDRAPAPRKNSKRRAEWEQKHPDRIKVLKDDANDATPPGNSKRKKKKDGEPTKSAEAELREQSMFSLLELMRPDEAQKSDAPPAVAGSQAPATASLPAAKASRKPQPKNAVVCTTCIKKRMKCNGAKPRCGSCESRDWPCWYDSEPVAQALNAGRAQQGSATSASSSAMPNFDAVHHSNDFHAANLAAQNETLQKELATVRQEQLNHAQETNDLKAQLAEVKKHLEALRTEPARLATPQPTPNLNMGHERRSGSQHHLPAVPVSQQSSYTPVTPQYQNNTPQTPQYPNAAQQTTQYQNNAQHLQNTTPHLQSNANHLQTHTSHLQNNGQHLYNQPTASQAAHRGAPVYQPNPNERAQPNNTWGPSLYGAYHQSTQQGNGMLGGHQSTQSANGMFGGNQPMGRYG